MNDKRNPYTWGPARPTPSLDDSQRSVEKDRGLRAQALASLLRRGATSLAHVIRRGLRAAIDVTRAFARAIVRAHERRAAIRELMALDDRTLKDIGVRRDDIYSVVEELLKDYPLAPVGTTRPEMTERNSRFSEKYGQIRFLIRRGLRAAIDAGRALAGVIVRARKRRATYRELMALDDRTLKDIGLHRSQIPSVVEEMFNTPARSVSLAEMGGTTRKAGESAVNDDDFESAA